LNFSLEEIGGVGFEEGIPEDDVVLEAPAEFPPADNSVKLELVEAVASIECVDIDESARWLKCVEIAVLKEYVDSLSLKNSQDRGNFVT